MKKLLWISPYAPYDTVAHAGGKVHNYYIKYFQKSGEFDITLLSLCLKNEEEHLDLDKYGIKNQIFVMDKTRWSRFRRRATSALSYINPFDRYAGVCLTYERKRILQLLNAYEKAGNIPEIVILQWTFSAMLTPVIKRKFPDCRIVDIEEDVTFLGYQRKYKAAANVWGKWLWRCKYRIIKKMELSVLAKANMVVTNNPKDTKLLTKNGILKESIFTSMPYFDDYSNIKRNVIGKDILFFGAMSRAENYKSAIWFIEKVMPLLEEREIRFIVVGSNPDQILKRYESDDVRIVGYVEDVSPYFEKCSCLVAPLVYGAGIKVKILEALSSGIPVLTNEIGIEGISAINGKDYFLCRTPQEYAEIIQSIILRKVDVNSIEHCAKTFIEENYCMDATLREMINFIQREKINL